MILLGIVWILGGGAIWIPPIITGLVIAWLTIGLILLSALFLAFLSPSGKAYNNCYKRDLIIKYSALDKEIKNNLPIFKIKEVLDWNDTECWELEKELNSLQSEWDKRQEMLRTPKGQALMEAVKSETESLKFVNSAMKESM
jgi:hypothetical protein